jgi:hypothetical protein
MSSTTASADATHPTLDTDAVDAVVDRAVRRIAPLWPLERFVAVNPWFGLADHDVEQAARRMARVAGARMTLPRRFYADAIVEGRIRDSHLEAALADARAGAAEDPGRHALLPDDVEEFKTRVLADPDAEHSPAELVPTVSDVVGRLTDTDWTHAVTERISLWAGAHFDEGQASWSSPFGERTPFAAWKAEAELDRAPEILGIAGFRAFARQLPEDAGEAIVGFLQRLRIPVDGIEIYLHRLLMSVGGWAAWARYHQWEAELHGGSNDCPVHLLAIRLAHEVALLEAFADQGSEGAWERARDGLDHDLDLSGPFGEMQVDLVLQNAFEAGWHEEMVGRFQANADSTSDTRAVFLQGRGGESSADGATLDGQRPEVRAAFCIDVRSEVFRRALEAQSEGIRTTGFAGFFGFPIEVTPTGATASKKMCPVLLTPAATIRETVADDDARTADAARKRTLRRTAKRVWKSFKMGAVSCFGFVGPVGLAYAGKLFGDGFGLTRPVADPATEALSRGERDALAPSITPSEVEGRLMGLGHEDRLETAEGVLRAMSMTEDFAKIVLLAGHGSTTVNNPHATGLDCGACGGHTGEANARVAAAVLNDDDVRAGLRERGIEVPDDTWFVAGLHDTTTDEVRLFDTHRVPAGLRPTLERLEEQLAAAGRLARAERATALKVPTTGEPTTGTDRKVLARSRDWSQVRPEWGLAGCAAFVAAPRERTAGLDLGGRSFLHDYAWQADEGYGVLELIMTAPMVVASWISLQYYGSTVDNEVFGCGNKTLHNVVGTLGVLEGNGGDLRVGLPWQSVHDGERYVHEPLRLNVIIEAPREAMNDIISRHEHVAHLLDNGWLNLWQMDEAGALAFRYDGDLAWTPVQRPEVDETGVEETRVA